MLYMLEVGKVGKALMVGFEDCGCLDSLNTIFGEMRSHLVEDKRGDTLILIVGAYSNQ